MCNICNIKKSIEKKKIECKATDSNVLETLENDLKIIYQHQSFYINQNKEYKDDINEVDKDSCVIIIDYKENLKIGGGLIETNNCFYEKTPISVLGFAVAFKINNRINMNIMITFLKFFPMTLYFLVNAL